MTYIPVGTILTYTASISSNLLGGFNGRGSLENILASFAQTLKSELPGAEEFDIQTSHGSPAFAGPSQISVDILNNGVDHGSEIDCQSIFDGVLQGMNITLLSSSITSIKLPNNPTDDINQGQTISTGAPPNLIVAPSATPTVGGNSSGFSFSSLLPSTGTKLLTSGVIIIIAIVALIFLLPQGFARSLRAVRR